MIKFILAYINLENSFEIIIVTNGMEKLKESAKNNLIQNWNIIKENKASLEKTTNKQGRIIEILNFAEISCILSSESLINYKSTIL